MTIGCGKFSLQKVYLLRIGQVGDFRYHFIRIIFCKKLLIRKKQLEIPITFQFELIMSN